MLSFKRPVTRLIIHHTATPRGRDVRVDEIRRWHKQRGFKDIGYHDVILISGDIFEGRDRNVPGAHCVGHNKDSIGIVLVGDGREGFEKKQWAALSALVKYYVKIYGIRDIKGHKDYAKTLCPGFDVGAWLEQEKILH